MSARAPRRPVPFWLWPWCAFLFLVPFEQLIPGPPFILIEVGAAALLVLAPRRGASLATGRFLAVSALFLVICASFFVSLYPAESQMPLFRVGVAYLTYVLAASAALTPGELSLALRSWFWGGAAAAAALLTFGSGGRATMAVGAYAAEPNFFTADLLLPAAIGLYWLGRKGHRLEAGVGLGLILGATLATQSRGGLLALLVVVAMLLVFQRRIRTLVAAGVVLVGLYTAFAPSLGRYDMTQDPTGSQRTVIWEQVLPVGVEHWATGIGLNTTRFHTLTLPGLYEEKSAHNTYVQAFVETGLFGLLALLAVVAAHLRLRAEHPAGPAYRAGLWGLAVAAVFLHMLAVQALWIAWIVAAQVAASRPAAAPLPVRRRAWPGATLGGAIAPRAPGGTP